MLGIDGAGNVTLAWRKRVVQRFDVWARRIPKGGAWGAPTLLEQRDTGSVDWLEMGVGSDGTAISVWSYDTENDIWAAVFR